MNTCLFSNTMLTNRLGTESLESMWVVLKTSSVSFESPWFLMTVRWCSFGSPLVSFETPCAFPMDCYGLPLYVPIVFLLPLLVSFGFTRETSLYQIEVLSGGLLNVDPFRTVVCLLHIF